MPTGHVPIPRKHNEHDAKRYTQVNQAGNYRAGGYNHAGEIYFGNEVGITYQAVTAFAQCIAEELPG